MNPKLKQYIIQILIAVLGALLMAGVFTFMSMFTSCGSTVEYKEYTDNRKCNIAIMLVKVKSMKGYEAFEVSEFVRECFSDTDRNDCKKSHFGKSPINYDKKDDRYLNYVSCLAERKK